MAFSRRDFVAALCCTGAASLAQAADKGSVGSGGGAGSEVFVVATITVKAGQRQDFLRIFKDNVPNVRAEKGCRQYVPVVDIASGIGAQISMRDSVVTVVECWENLDALKAHLVAPHMDAYREKVKDMVESVSLQVLRPA